MPRATITYACDWTSDNGDDQRGHIRVELPLGGGVIEGTWSATGGMGDGAEFVSNSTRYPNCDAEGLLNETDLCQGDGTFTAMLDYDESDGSWDITDVEWPAEAK